ncbi:MULTISPECIES: hypothetical protein [unclassified Glutamicibacter]|uniref:DUF6414 family protein n=1 Tax=unclassified Glutamicibacter TaxID=2627139 RepID=UPI00382B50C0
MATRKTQDTAFNQQQSAPTVTVYQNPDHVSGILQQIYRAPLVKEDTTEGGGTNTATETTTVDGSAEGTGNIGWLGSKLGLTARMSAGEEVIEAQASTQNRRSVWEYTQAYYLHVVRESLRHFGLLHTVATLSDAETLKVGDLVEYTTEFKPDQMSAFLDVLSPELIASVVRFQAKQKALKAFEKWGDFDAQQAYFAETGFRADAQAEFAASVTRAIRKDFRSDGTREFFGNLGSENYQVTAITMCDAAYFTVEDTDRILDGRFTVLGKVAESVEHDRPTLERNKLLSSVPVESFETLVDELMEQADQGLKKAKITGAMAFDLGLSARIDGASFKVIPIAIYV